MIKWYKTTVVQREKLVGGEEGVGLQEMTSRCSKWPSKAELLKINPTFPNQFSVVNTTQKSVSRWVPCLKHLLTSIYIHYNHYLIIKQPNTFWYPLWALLTHCATLPTFPPSTSPTIPSLLISCLTEQESI